MRARISLFKGVERGVRGSGKRPKKRKTCLGGKKRLFNTDHVLIQKEELCINREVDTSQGDRQSPEKR